jgi:hypothetical protein
MFTLLKFKKMNIRLFEGIRSITVALMAAQADIVYDPIVCKLDDIIAKINSLGYRSELLANSTDLLTKISFHVSLLIQYI